jgi:uncharacterized protein YjaG (DUF416 family)
MNLEFYDLNALKQELKALSPLHRIVFAASICERLLPNYNAFCRMENWGDPSVLRKALDEIWQVVLQGKSIDVVQIHQFQEDLNRVCPDSESDDVCDACYLFEAQQAVFAIDYTLIACLEPGLQHIIQVVQCVRFHTIEAFIEEKDESFKASQYENEFEAIANHPMAVREMAKENEDLQRLKEVEALEPEFLEWLRTSFDNGGRSLIDLS